MSEVAILLDDLQPRDADPHLSGARVSLDDVAGIDDSDLGELTADAVDVELQAARLEV